MLNKQDEKLFQELLKKYKQGLISGLIQGNNVTLTSTGCRNKIISSTGGGGSSTLFPNGIEFVNASRDFRASDAGKRLFVSGENAVISMPEVNPFAVGDYVGIINNGDNISFTTEYGGEPIFSLKTGDGSTSECVVLMNTEIEGSSWLFPISTSFKYDNTDSKNKTALRYLYDKSQNAIPLSGTEVGKPVTGDIEFQTEENTEEARKLYSTLSGIERRLLFDWESTELRIELFDILNDLVLSKFILTPNTVTLSTDDGTVQSSLQINNAGIYYSSNEPTCVGYSSNQDFTANITDLDYTQKKYVDTHIAFTSVPTSSTDTGVKGQMAVDATYLYVCVATDTWTRVALIW